MRHAQPARRSRSSAPIARTLDRRASSEPIANRAGACLGAAAARAGAREGQAQVGGIGDSRLRAGADFEGNAFEPEHDHPDRLSYGPSPWWTLPRALRFLGVSDRDTFVDFGCGKGRVVHQAAKRPFRRVIGVEISPALAEIARANLAARRHQHRCPNVEIVVADAREFPVPDDLTVGYFWDPFTGETLKAVLRGIVDSIDRHPRPVRLIYLGHRGAEVLATGRFRLLKEHRPRGRGWPTAIFEVSERAQAPGHHRREARRPGCSRKGRYGISEYLVQPPSGRET